MFVMMEGLNEETNHNTLLDTMQKKHQKVTEDAGLIARRRVIFVFRDRHKALDNVYGDTFNAIQLNVSTTRGDKVFCDTDFVNYVINRDQSFANNNSVYVYTGKMLRTQDVVHDFMAATGLAVISCKRLYRETDMGEGETRSSATNLFSTSNPHWSLGAFTDSKALNDPRYYTHEHEELASGNHDNANIATSVQYEKFNGYDLIDDKTTVVEKDMSEYETIRERLFGMDGASNAMNMSYCYGDHDEDIEIIDPTVALTNQANEVITNTSNLLELNNLANGGIFLYDSKGEQWRYKDPSVMGKKYMMDSAVKSELETFRNIMLANAKVVESKFGDIHMEYIPSMIGPKCKIIFREWGDQKVEDGTDSHDELNGVSTHLINETSLMNHDDFEDVVNYDDILARETFKFR